MNNSTEKKARRIATLLAAYIHDTLSPSEHDELDEWVGASDKNMRLFEELTDENKIQLALKLLNDNGETGLVRKLQDDPNYVYVRKRRLNRIVAAASIVALVGTAIFFLSKNNSDKSSTSLNTIATSSLEILPGSKKATLELAGKIVITLANVNDGTIGAQGNTSISKHNGQLKYDCKAGAIQYALLPNTLTTPLGGNYSLTLSDGTKLWLNSGSSVSYPASFGANERRVVITGEVYFEVASAKVHGPNYKKPFIVQVKDKDMAVEVMGTHFNINAYGDEPVIKTTLVEGAVKVATASQVDTLKPNQQAQVSNDGEINILNVDTDFDTRWKDGLIRLSPNNLAAAMRTVGRWYNIEVAVDNDVNIPEITSGGTINLQNNLADALKGLDPTHKHLKLVGRKLTVTP